MNAPRITVLASCLAIAVGTLPATAWAQAAEPAAAEANGGEIIVTATKRAVRTPAIKGAIHRTVAPD